MVDSITMTIRAATVVKRLQMMMGNNKRDVIKQIMNPLAVFRKTVPEGMKILRSEDM
jgi:Cu/Ag efflux pump CusA